MPKTNNSFIYMTRIILPTTTLIHTYHTTINKSGHCYSPVSRDTLAVRLTANMTAGHLLIHLIGGATLAVINISPTAAFITFIILILLSIL
ncbi:hypothetical protein HPG69_014696 [Diceros bicornis minor]|uniref:ATP synthase F(0) complex subunit a n=1 Tax=Diceros bicornis minor TaxID=77932 RepID=A0A7J7EY13_DICBM|nr:hypothetical protein HPG69_014696 [Diceros bicornis minor]